MAAKALTVTVTDPQKMGDGLTAYMTYKVSAVVRPLTSRSVDARARRRAPKGRVARAVTPVALLWALCRIVAARRRRAPLLFAFRCQRHRRSASSTDPSPHRPVGTPRPAVGGEARRPGRGVLHRRAPVL